MSSSDVLLQKVVSEIFNPLFQLAVVISILYFLYGVMRFVIALNTSNVDDQKSGKQHLLWGSVGLFIILSIGGIFHLFSSIFNGLFGMFG